MSNEQRTHFPVQAEFRYRNSSEICAPVYLRAYEVYCELYGPQQAMVTGWCRGGMGPGELIAFLYAHSFPKEQWAARAREAFEGMKPCPQTPLRM
jgi:hypothetical protein